jgi:hypothetical protein
MATKTIWRERWIEREGGWQEVNEERRGRSNVGVVLRGRQRERQTR